MRKYEIDAFNQKEVQALGADLSENNNVIVETAGFIPLEVKMKRFEQAGQIAQFNVSEFTSQDYRNLYLNPNFDINPEDDFEDVQEKLLALQNYQNEYLNKISKNSPPSGEMKEGDIQKEKIETDKKVSDPE